jgi:hypothetical protein
VVYQYLNFVLLLGKLPYRWSISVGVFTIHLETKSGNRRNAEDTIGAVVEPYPSVSLQVFSSFLGISWDIMIFL